MIIINDGEEPKYFPGVSRNREGRYMFLCTFRLDGVPRLVYHEFGPDDDRQFVNNYLNFYDGTVTDIIFWQESR